VFFSDPAGVGRRLPPLTGCRVASAAGAAGMAGVAARDHVLLLAGLGNGPG
jgi:hypothetical protein